MSYEVRLRTGYYKTEQYDMFISGDGIRLSSLSCHDKDIAIGDIDFITVSMIQNKNPSMEIQSNNSIYTCFLCEATDLDEILSSIRKKFNKNTAIVFN